MPPVVFSLLALLALAKLLWTGRALFYDVLFKLFFPNQMFFRREILAGHFPLWNPHLYSGVPYLANLQSALFYPFTYVHLLLDFPAALAFNTWAHIALAGLFAYLLARSLELSKPASYFGAIAFSLNGHFILRYAFPSNFHAYVWLPLILLAGFRKDLKLRQACALGAAALALQLFAGHPQFLLYSLLACGLCAAFAQDRGRWLAFLACSGGLFLALGAVQLVPSALFTLDSVRTLAPDLDWALAYSLRPGELLVMLLAPQWNRYFTPASGDPHMVGFYFGPFILLGAARAFRLPARRWLPFAALALLGFLLALGKYFPLYPLLYRTLPPLRALRFPCQALYLSCLGLSLLAGLGLETLTPRLRRWLPVLAALDLLAFAAQGIITVDPAVYRTPPPLAERLKEDREFSRILLTPRTRAHWRMGGRNETDAWLRFKNCLFPNFPMAYGLYAADGREELRYRRYEKILEEIDQNPLSPWLDILGVRHVLSLWEMPAKFRPLAKGTPNVFENPAAFPKAYVAAGLETVTDEEALLRVRRRGAAPLLRSALAAEPQDPPRSPCLSLRSLVRVARYGSQGMRLEVESSCPGWLVLTDGYDPGWQARVNGERARVLRVNLTQRGVRIPAGRSVVDFFYRPEYLTSLIIASALGWGLVLFLLLGGRFRPADGA